MWLTLWCLDGQINDKFCNIYYHSAPMNSCEFWIILSHCTQQCYIFAFHSSCKITTFKEIVSSYISTSLFQPLYHLYYNLLALIGLTLFPCSTTIYIFGLINIWCLIVIYCLDVDSIFARFWRLWGALTQNVIIYTPTVRFL